MQITADQNIYLAQNCFEDLAPVTLLPAEQITKKNLKKTDILLIRSKTQIDQTLLEQTPVKFVGSTVSGTDHIDFSYVQEKNIHLAVAKGCNANSVAEYCMIALLELIASKNITLKHKRVGIIGYGSVGQKFAEKFTNVDGQILCYDPPLFRVQSQQTKPNTKITVTNDIKDIMACDIISLHAALNGSKDFPSKHLLNQKLIQTLSSDQILINTSRGDIVDEVALIEHCQHTKTHLIIDCWDHEPHIKHDLLKQTFIGTPHIAGHSVQAKLNGTLYCRNQLLNWLGKLPQIQVPHPPHSHPPSIEVNLKGCQTIEQALLKIYQTHYLPTQDNLNVQFNPTELSRSFTHQRDNYRLRNELNSTLIHLIQTPPHFAEELNTMLAQSY